MISDEIHGDLALGDRKYIPFAKLASPLGVRVLTGAAASKTFNIPGLTTAFWIVPDEKLRLGLVDRLQAYKVTETNLLGLVATKACYTHGEAWLDELKQYLFYNAYFNCSFATSTSCANAFASVTARSAIILRLTSTPALVRPLIKRL